VSGESLLGTAVGLALAAIALAGLALLAQAAWAQHGALRAEVAVTAAWLGVSDRLAGDVREGAVDDARLANRPVAYADAREVRLVVGHSGGYRCVAWRLGGEWRLHRAVYISAGCPSPAPDAWVDAVTLSRRAWSVAWPRARFCSPSAQEVILADAVDGACGGTLTARGPDGLDRALPPVRGLSRAAR